MNPVAPPCSRTRSPTSCLRLLLALAAMGLTMGHAQATTLPFDATSPGFASFTAPVAGIYSITAIGAEGGNGWGGTGGLGAIISGEFSLDLDDVLTILVGGMGGSN